MTTDPHFGGRLPVMGEASQEVGVMPRNTIFPDHQATDGVRVGVSVGWDRDHTVQIGTSLEDDITSGHFVCLSRNEINSLVRSLRKARDQAYGADA